MLVVIYRTEVSVLAIWCTENNLDLTTPKKNKNSGSGEPLETTVSFEKSFKIPLHHDFK